MSVETIKAIQSLREQGYAVAIFHPDELQGADRGDIETAMVREGNEAIDLLKPYSDEEAA